MVQDVIFIATLTRSGGTFTVDSGSNSPVTQTAGPGVQIFQVPMGVGVQVFNFEADGKKGSDSPNVTISAECWVSALACEIESSI
jgi:glucan endo-1,3-alpha-glucosidase